MAEGPHSTVIAHEWSHALVHGSALASPQSGRLNDPHATTWAPRPQPLNPPPFARRPPCPQDLRLCPGRPGH